MFYLTKKNLNTIIKTKELSEYFGFMLLGTATWNLSYLIKHHIKI